LVGSRKERSVGLILLLKTRSLDLAVEVVPSPLMVEVHMSHVPPCEIRKLAEQNTLT